jgi:hypothetical protein
MANSRSHQHADGWNSDDIFRSMRRNAEAYKKKDMELIKVKEELEIHRKNTKELNIIKKEINHFNSIMDCVSSGLKDFIKPFNCEVNVCAEKGDFDSAGENNFNASIKINGDDVINFEFYEEDSSQLYWEGSLCLNDYEPSELGVVNGEINFERGKFLDLNSRFDYKAYRIGFKENNLLLLYLELKGYNYFTNGYWPFYTYEKI